MTMNAKNRVRLVGLLFLGLFVLACPVLATPRDAAAPVGVWTATTPEGDMVTLQIIEDGGFYLEWPSKGTVTGTWTWLPNSHVAGTLVYEPAPMSGGTRTVYNVVWMGTHRIEVTTPAFTMTLNRMI
jgi:hypothetical protein